MADQEYMRRFEENLRDWARETAQSAEEEYSRAATSLIFLFYETDPIRIKTFMEQAKADIHCIQDTANDMLVKLREIEAIKNSK